MFRVKARIWNKAGRISFTPLLRTLTHGSQPSYIDEIRDSVVGHHVKTNQEDVSSKNALKFAFFSNKHNSMSQRLCLELEKRNHNVKVTNDFLKFFDDFKKLRAKNACVAAA